MRIIRNIINLCYPLLFSILFIAVKIIFKINYSIKGLENVLESIITFSSIIIGFYTAMYGVMITLKDSDVMKEFRARELTGLLKFQLYDSLVASFSILGLSVLLQIGINYHNNITKIIFLIWFAVLGYFCATSFRAITLLLNIMFNSDNQNKTVQRDEDENARLERYRRIKNNHNNEGL